MIDDRRGNSAKKTVSDTYPLKGPVVQRSTRLTTSQENSSSKPARLGESHFTPMFWVEQNKTNGSTGTRRPLPKPREEMIKQRGHSLYFGDES